MANQNGRVHGVSLMPLPYFKVLTALLLIQTLLQKGVHAPPPISNILWLKLLSLRPISGKGLVLWGHVLNLLHLFHFSAGDREEGGWGRPFRSSH